MLEGRGPRRNRDTPKAPPPPTPRRHPGLAGRRGISRRTRRGRGDREPPGYRFYSIGVGERLEGQSRGQRAWHLFKTLFWAIIEKLSPARRVLLLLGLILLFFSSGISYADKAGEIHVFAFDFRLVGGLLIFVVLLLELADRVVMKRDLEIAKDIQSWLLPGAPLQIPGYSIAYATRPANTVAGDYYDVILRPEATPDQDRVLFAVADVAGKAFRRRC